MSDLFQPIKDDATVQQREVAAQKQNADSARGRKLLNAREKARRALAKAIRLASEREAAFVQAEAAFDLWEAGMAQQAGQTEPPATTEQSS